MTFGERLVALREENGYSKRNAFAKKLGIPETTLRNYEKDEREPGHTFLKQISDTFNVSVDYLLGLTNEKEKKASYSLKSSEWEHIQKYRQLDLVGQETVSYILDRESARVKALADAAAEIASLKSQLETCSSLVSIEDMRPKYYITYYHKLASAGRGEYLFEDIPTDLIAVEDTPVARRADFVIGVIGDSMEPTYHDGDRVFVEKMEEIPTGAIGIFVNGNDCFIKELGTDRLISHNNDKILYPDIPASEEIRCVGLVLGKI